MLSTHVLDVSQGRPAAGIEVALYRITSAERACIASARTDVDGRIHKPFGGELTPGTYELSFQVAGYYAATFYDEIPIRFRILDANSAYHVPLLISPYGYSTYRGS